MKKNEKIPEIPPLPKIGKTYKNRLAEFLGFFKAFADSHLLPI